MKNDFTAVLVGLVGAYLVMTYIKKKAAEKGDQAADGARTRSVAMGVRG